MVLCILACLDKQTIFWVLRWEKNTGSRLPGGSTRGWVKTPGLFCVTLVAKGKTQDHCTVTIRALYFRMSLTWMKNKSWNGWENRSAAEESLFPPCFVEFLWAQQLTGCINKQAAAFLLIQCTTLSTSLGGCTEWAAFTAAKGSCILLLATLLLWWYLLCQVWDV